MSTKKSSSSTSSLPFNVPDVIVVSENFTNGLFHHEKDLDTILDILLEHIMLSSFVTESVKSIEEGEKLSIEDCERWVADFVVYRIEASVENNLKFKKMEHILHSRELLEFVKKGRELIEFPNPETISVNSKNLLRYHQELVKQLEGFQESLRRYVTELFSESFTK